MEYNFPTDRQDVDLARDYQHESRAEAAYQADLHETSCTPEEIAAYDPTCECGHLKSEHRAGFAYGLESYPCDVLNCRCGEVSYSYRIKAKPVRFAETAQGNLFNEEVA